MDQYEFRECEWEGCLFRFPTQVGMPGGNRCPKCGAATHIVAHPVGDTGPSPARDGTIIVGVLDNIRSIHNVGSIFRSADGAGLQHLFLSGITATPSHPKLTKAALGAQERVSWTHALNGPVLARALKQEGYQLLAVETDAMAQSLFDDALSLRGQPLAIVVGNERAGIDPGILEQCQYMVSLPMGGAKRSLNVAVAFGIVAYHLRYGKQI